jgi:hypothetical protein
MRRAVLSIAIFVLAGAASVFAQVQTAGDVSFAVLDGWQYQQGTDFGALTVKSDNRFWMVAVYSSMPSRGDANADFAAAWNRVLAPIGYRLPNYSYYPYDISQTVGYPGKYYDASSGNNSSYARLYVLETGKSCVPVAFISHDRGMLDGMEHNARAVVGSVRVAPLKASPIRYSISVADLPGYWASGLVTSIDYYNSSGQYQSNSLTAVRYGYNIAADGSYTYKFGGLVNNRMTNDDDAGVVELGDGFLTFKGRKHVNRYRFVNLQQALDGSSVITLFPPVDMSQVTPSRDSTFFTRPVKK